MVCMVGSLDFTAWGDTKDSVPLANEWAFAQLKFLVDLGGCAVLGFGFSAFDPVCYPKEHFGKQAYVPSSSTTISFVD